MKGFSPLHIVNSFRIPECVPIDYMHSVLLGIARKLSKLWFDSSSHKNYRMVQNFDGGKF